MGAARDRHLVDRWVRPVADRPPEPPVHAGRYRPPVGSPSGAARSSPARHDHRRCQPGGTTRLHVRPKDTTAHVCRRGHSWPDRPNNTAHISSIYNRATLDHTHPEHAHPNGSAYDDTAIERAGGQRIGRHRAISTLDPRGSPRRTPLGNCRRPPVLDDRSRANQPRDRCLLATPDHGERNDHPVGRPQPDLPGRTVDTSGARARIRERTPRECTGHRRWLAQA